MEIDESELTTSKISSWSGDDLKITDFPTYIQGLDELAESLGISPNTQDFGITLHGKIGNYSLVVLLNAHVALMKKVLEVSK